MKFLSQRGVVRDVRYEDESDPRGGGNLGERSRFPNKEISILLQRHYFFLSGRSFTLVVGGGELVKTFRSGDEEVFSRVGRVPLVDVDGVVGGSR